MDKLKIIIIILLLVIFAITLTLLSLNNKKTNNFKIYVFNAGKADAILIENNNTYIMIDTGEEDLSTGILDYFKKNNITKLDYLIITHFDKDHVGSASSIIDNIEIDNVLQSNSPKDSEYYNNYINSLNNKNIEPITISGDKEYNIEDLKFIVNGPETIYDKNESNNSSLIVSLYYKNTSYLFMGDAENARIKDYLTNHNESYDFIKIPYHGNYLKRLEELLSVVNPKYAIITNSKKEGAEQDTLDLLEDNNIKYYLTSNGKIIITSDGNSININQ